MKVLVSADAGTASMRTAVRKMAEAAMKGLGMTGCELSVLLTDNERIRELNREYRSIDRPTDVLSFPMDDPVLIGDVVISVDKAAAQAEAFGCSLDEETSRLVVHGILHLAGYDHVTGGRQARKMKEKEEELMALLKDRALY